MGWEKVGDGDEEIDEKKDNEGGRDEEDGQSEKESKAE